MMRRSAYADDLDEDDAILKDGASLRVPLRLMDEKFVDSDRSRRLQFFGDNAGGFVGHRPGFASPSTMIDAAAIADREAAWQERGRINRDAWRAPPSPPPFERARPGSERAQDAHNAPGRAQTAARAASRSTAAPGVFDHAAREDADRAYEERAEMIRNAWKQG